MRRAAAPLLVTLITSIALAVDAAPAAAQRVLFDGRHGETAGEADWIVDADSSEQVWLNFQCHSPSRHHSAQRFPTPPQSAVTAATAETFWNGGISAWAIDLVKDALDPARGRSWQIEQYPWDAPEMTFGDPGNEQDLSNYDVLILCEPNVAFSDAEAQAIREFVANGGGLFLIADHETSDRNCSGGPGVDEDSPAILNRLMQTHVDTSGAPPYFDPSDPDNDFGVFGIWFHENGNDDPDDPANRAFDWFDEAKDDNVAEDPADPIVHGPFGDGTGGLGLFGSTSMAVSTHPDKGNPTARAHVWRTGQDHAPNALGVSDRVTFASAEFGAGRVVAIGDSSPADDGTGEGHLHPGWDRASLGVANDVLFLNATEWLANPTPDREPPVITAGPTVVAADCSATVTWVTDEPATSRVELGTTDALGGEVTGAGLATGHRVELGGLAPATPLFVRVSSLDAAGNGPATSATVEAATGEQRPPTLLTGPAAGAVGARGATISWTTDKPGSAAVRYAPAAGGAQQEATAAGPTVAPAIALAGLSPDTEYAYEAATTDACGATVSATGRFTTLAAPATVDLSDWRLVNDNPQFAYTFPAGTEVPVGALVVVGRDNPREAFEAEWGPLPEGAVYLDSGDSIVVNSTPRPYTLLDASGQPADGPTVDVRAGRSRHRLDGCGAAGNAAAWGDRAAAAGDPGRGAPAGCSGVHVIEIADGRDYRNEFVEILVAEP